MKFVKLVSIISVIFISYQHTNKKIKCLFVAQFIHLLIMLSRKAEGLDPLKPWQPLILRKVLHSTSIAELISAALDR